MQKRIESYSGRFVTLDTSETACAEACKNLGLPTMKPGDLLKDMHGTSKFLGTSMENGKRVLWHCYLNTQGGGYNPPP
jgi:hypothetical protein